MNTNPYVIDPQKVYFSLDGGTRTIVGLLSYPEENGLRVLDVEIREHPERHMLDGQIHNVEKVSATAKEVKESLEKRTGIPLSSVSVAAAGRALTTLRERAEQELNPDHKILPEEIIALELEAMKKATRELLGDEINGLRSYYCIGYTPIHYYLNGYPISSLASQQGQTMAVEVLVTFLPATVVDSLLTVVEKIGLSLHNMTLEPIAAIQVLIPPDYRFLNLALVDIGAGTSDIAITDQGSVIAYDMVPMAGDEITEKIADHYLLDFNTAETIKCKLNTFQENFRFQDIIGNYIEVTREDILEIIAPVVENIADRIASSIVYYNQKPPRALFCIGGGSKLPLLREKLSELLGIPLERVALRDYESIKGVTYDGEILKGPECVTPMGIAATSLEEKYFGFASVTVNGKVVRLLQSEPTSISRVLLAAGFNTRDLIGRRGASKKITINGQTKIFPGKPGKSAEIKLNGENATMETYVQDNDTIIVEKASPGDDARITLENIINYDDYYIILNDQKLPLPPKVLVNGEPVEENYELDDGDEVSIGHIGTLEDLKQMAGLEFPPEGVMVNGTTVKNETYQLRPGDRVEW